MGQVDGFLKFGRETPKRRDVGERLEDWKEVYKPFPELKLVEQGARCMDCGVPFCHTGCPLGNLIPDWNDLVYRQNWQEAIRRLHSTNNFPEFTGRLCPAPCEEACVLGINEPAVTIKNIENSIIDRAFSEGWVVAEPPERRTGKKVAIVGSGPAGLACAQQLNRAGHEVTVFERADRIGGLLRYGIPEFKMEKAVLDRRLQQLAEEGIVFRTNADVGVNVPVKELQDNFDAIVLCGGATAPRDLPIPGRELKGVEYAMDFLTPQNKKCHGDAVTGYEPARGKKVVIIGGGDTGADCLGTVHRHKCDAVVQLELLPKPPEGRNESMPWPYWPTILRTSSAHEEGGQRDWSVVTESFSGKDGHVTHLNCARLEWYHENGRTNYRKLAGSEFQIEADLVLLAMGFTGTGYSDLLTQLGVEKTTGIEKVIANDDYMTNVPGVFAAGDARRGQSLIVWAIWEGREAAVGVDKFLMGYSDLPSNPQLLGRDARAGAV
jgi:glutamate synthase (NADPH) small chain